MSSRTYCSRTAERTSAQPIIATAIPMGMMSLNASAATLPTVRNMIMTRCNVPVSTVPAVPADTPRTKDSYGEEGEEGEERMIYI